MTTSTETGLSLPAQARKSGICFYSLPEELTPEQIDPLIRDIVFSINKSGWVWTAESCQGHPEAETPPWAGNISPMLRLVCRRKDLGRMMAALVEAMYIKADNDDLNDFGHFDKSLGFRAFPSWHTNKDWVEILIYIDAVCVYDRNLGLRAFAQFAEKVNHESQRSVD